jgi:hypothetical protein
VRLADPGKSDAAPATGEPGPPRMVTLFPGMNGRANFLSKALDAQTLNAPPKLEVAASAISMGANGPFVLTIDSKGVLQAAHVVVGSNDGDRVILKEAPPAGTLVVQNPDGLKPGRRAKPLQ